MWFDGDGHMFVKVLERKDDGTCVKVLLKKLEFKILVY